MVIACLFDAKQRNLTRVKSVSIHSIIFDYSWRQQCSESVDETVVYNVNVQRNLKVSVFCDFRQFLKSHTFTVLSFYTFAKILFFSNTWFLLSSFEKFAATYGKPQIFVRAVLKSAASDSSGKKNLFQSAISVNFYK